MNKFEIPLYESGILSVIFYECLIPRYFISFTAVHTKTRECSVIGHDYFM